MQICATSLAQFFVQDEYYAVTLDANYLTFKSNHDEVEIPLSMWNGQIKVERGVIWGQLYFYSHPDSEASQSCWLVQGLPWDACQIFAQQLINYYQDWYHSKMKLVSAQLPSWATELRYQIHQVGYLAQSVIGHWHQKVTLTLDELELSLPALIQNLPPNSSMLEAWLLDPFEQLRLRNEAWLKQTQVQWKDFFAHVDKGALNSSQQYAVLQNCDRNLVLAGAGSGKTSVLVARVGYLLESKQSQTGDDILLIAFARSAAQEMHQRLAKAYGHKAQHVQVKTFHQLSLDIIRSVEKQNIERQKIAVSQGVRSPSSIQKPMEIAPMVLDDHLRQEWYGQWLHQHWQTLMNFKRWQKHLSHWPIAFLKGDSELATQSENPKLLAWLENQVNQLLNLGISKQKIQDKLATNDESERLLSELDLVWPCYLAWQKTLKDNHQLDFYSMISLATSYLEQGLYQPKWQFVMVDEYQDISPMRLSLLDQICYKSQVASLMKPCTLYAVGDDWQSIYQFSGADINLTTRFENQFDYANICNLDTTYRFNNKLADVANRFVMKNPLQTRRKLISAKQSDEKSVHIASMKNLESTIAKLALSVNQSSSKQRKHVLILGRTHQQKPKQLSQWQQEYLQLEIKYMTCHASKGQEADIVMVLNLDQNVFPPKQRSYHLNDVLIKNEQETFEFAEERRLLYVAMTRAKEKAWLFYGAHPSLFIRELSKDGYAVEVEP